MIDFDISSDRKISYKEFFNAYLNLNGLSEEEINGLARPARINEFRI